MASIKIRFLRDTDDGRRAGDLIDVDGDDPSVREWLQNRHAEPVPEQLPAEPVRVKALQWHTTHGETHEAGDIYEAAADLVDTLRAQGKAVPEGEAPPAEPAPVEPAPVEQPPA